MTSRNKLFIASKSSIIDYIINISDMYTVKLYFAVGDYIISPHKLEHYDKFDVKDKNNPLITLTKDEVIDLLSKYETGSSINIYGYDKLHKVINKRADVHNMKVIYKRTKLLYDNWLAFINHCNSISDDMIKKALDKKDRSSIKFVIENSPFYPNNNIIKNTLFHVYTGANFFLSKIKNYEDAVSGDKLNWYSNYNDRENAYFCLLPILEAAELYLRTNDEFENL